MYACWGEIIHNSYQTFPQIDQLMDWSQQWYEIEMLIVGIIFQIQRVQSQDESKRNLPWWTPQIDLLAVSFSIPNAASKKTKRHKQWVINLFQNNRNFEIIVSRNGFNLQQDLLLTALFVTCSSLLCSSTVFLTCFSSILNVSNTVNLCVLNNGFNSSNLPSSLFRELIISLVWL